MLKKTLCFENPGYIFVKDNQLVFQRKGSSLMSQELEEGESKSQQRYRLRLEELLGRNCVPIADIGFVVLESRDLVVSAYALDALAQNNVAVITCDRKMMPSAMLQPLEGHTLSHRNTIAQLGATKTKCDQLWKQTVVAKIRNQAECLSRHGREESERLLQLSKFITGGDPENREGQAAMIYFKAWELTRTTSHDTEGPDLTNSALNYGYAILRAAMARALVGSGLLCIRGIHHHSQYDAFALADDLMEPYRPFVDSLVFGNFFAEKSESGDGKKSFSREQKIEILKLLASDVIIDGLRRPLSIAMTMTSSSLAACFLEKEKRISFPTFD